MNLAKVLPPVLFAVLSSLLLGVFSSDLVGDLKLVSAPKSALPLFILLSLFLVCVFLCISIISIAVEEKSIKLAIFVFTALLFGIGTIFTSFYGIHLFLSPVLFFAALFVFDRSFISHHMNLIKPRLSSSVKLASKSFLSIFAILLTIFFFFANKDASVAGEITNALTQQIASFSPATQIIEDQINTQINDQMEKELEKAGAMNQKEIKTLLKQVNSQLGGLADLQQLGIDPSSLTATYQENSFKITGLDKQIEPIIKQEIEKIINKFEPYLLPVLTLVFYLTLSPLFSLLSFVIGPLINVLFVLLEKIRYLTKETQTVEVERFRM